MVVVDNGVKADALLGMDLSSLNDLIWQAVARIAVYRLSLELSSWRKSTR